MVRLLIYVDLSIKTGKPVMVWIEAKSPTVMQLGFFDALRECLTGCINQY